MARQSERFEFGPFRLDVRERRLTRDGHAIPLRGRVFDTLCALVRRHGCLLTKDELMAAVWPDSIVEETNLNHNICIIRRALGEKVTGQKYVETVSKQGYRFVAQVREVVRVDGSEFSVDWECRQGSQREYQPVPAAIPSVPTPQLPEGIPNRSHAAVPATRTGWLRRQATIPLLAVALLALAGYFGSQLGVLKSLTNSRIRLAVLPFEDLTGDAGQSYVAEGLCDEIISQLGGWNAARVGVIARTSSMVYQGTRKSIGEIGRELGVHYVVEGSVRRDQDQYRITVMLIRVKDQTHLWAASYNRKLDNVTALQVEIASLVTSEIGRKIEVKADRSFSVGHPPSFGTQPPKTQGVGSRSDSSVGSAFHAHLLIAR